MQAYRETRELRQPAALVRRALDDDERFARKEGRGTDGATEGWTATRWPYTTTAALDAARGELRLSVALASGYRPGAVLLPAVVLVGLSLGAPAWSFLTVLWAGVVLTLLPLGPLLVGPMPSSDGVSTVDRGLSRVVLAPSLATTLALFGTLRGVLPPAVAAAPAAVLSAVVVAAYLLAGTGHRVTALNLPLSGLLAPLLAATNLLVAAALLRNPASPTAAVGLAAALAVLLAVLFARYCRAALRRFAAAHLAPVPRHHRLAALGGYAALNLLIAGSALVALRAVLLAGTGEGGFGDAGPLGGSFLPAPATVGRAADTVVGGPLVPLATATFYALLVAPLGWLAAGWLGHLVGGAGGQVLALARAKPLATAGDGETPSEVPVPVRAVPTDHPLVRPVALTGVWRGVLVGRPVVAGLDPDELRAVVAHEAYHLDGRDVRVAGLASVAALAFGGRNALLAFYDYATAERAADAHAADVAGVEPLIRALRRLEALQAGGAAGAVPDGGGPDHDTGPALAGVGRRVGIDVWRTLRAPYDLFFGRVLLDAAHRPVDERVAALRDG